MIFLLLSTAMAAPLAECSHRYEASEVFEAVDLAESGFVQVRPEQLESGAQRVVERLACLSQPLNTQQIARLHLLFAIVDFYHGKVEQSKAGLAAMLATAPGYDYSPLLPADHPLRAYMSEAGEMARDRSERPLRTDRQEKWWIEVDGAAAPAVPSHRNAMLQQMDNQQNMLESRYYRPGDSLGSWDPSSKVKQPPPVPTDAAAPEPEEPEVTAPPEKSPSTVAFRAFLAPSLQSYAAADGERSLLYGGELALGVSLKMGDVLGLYGDVGYLGSLGAAPSGWEDLPGSSSHTVLLQGGAGLGFGTINLEIGPTLAFVHGQAAAKAESGQRSLYRLDTLAGGGSLGVGYALNNALGLRLESGFLLVAGSPWVNAALGLQIGG